MHLLNKYFATAPVKKKTTSRNIIAFGKYLENNISYELKQGNFDGYLEKATN